MTLTHDERRALREDMLLMTYVPQTVLRLLDDYESLYEFVHGLCRRTGAKSFKELGETVDDLLLDSKLR